MKNILLGGSLLFGVILAPAAEQVPVFSLRDMNLKSNRQGGLVSPRNYLLQVSGYYFGAAH
jgi:hypothetical protein